MSLSLSCFLSVSIRDLCHLCQEDFRMLRKIKKYDVIYDLDTVPLFSLLLDEVVPAFTVDFLELNVG